MVWFCLKAVWVCHRRPPRPLHRVELQRKTGFELQRKTGFGGPCRPEEAAVAGGGGWRRRRWRAEGGVPGRKEKGRADHAGWLVRAALMRPAESCPGYYNYGRPVAGGRRAVAPTRRRHAYPGDCKNLGFPQPIY